MEEHLNTYIAKKEELTVESGCVLWGTRVVISEKFREKLLKELHHEHPGICKTKGIARSYFWWPGLDKNIERLAKSCLECQAVKKAPSSAPLHPWTWPTRVFQHIHIDFAGPFQGAMFLVVVDAFSKWPEVFVMQSTTVNVLCSADTVIQRLWSQITDRSLRLKSSLPSCDVWCKTHSKCSVSPRNQRVGRTVRSIDEAVIEG